MLFLLVLSSDSDDEASSCNTYESQITGLTAASYHSEVGDAFWAVKDFLQWDSPNNITHLLFVQFAMRSRSELLWWITALRAFSKTDGFLI